MIRKFRPAVKGIQNALQDDSIRIQAFLGIAALFAGCLLKLTEMEWIAVILCIGIVLSMEILNTAVEKLCNRITKDYDDTIKTIKDLSAAAVLVVSMTSLIIAILILVSHMKGII